jgi:hypothetical protein
VRLDSAHSLKSELLEEFVQPFASCASRMRSVGMRGAVAALRGPAALVEDASLMAVGARPAHTLPTVQRSIALGVAPHGRDYRLAVRVQRPALQASGMVERLRQRAKGEIDIRMVGRIDKRGRAATRAPAAAVAWYRRNTRPLLIGASIGHVAITAGTLGCFVRKAGAIRILSNNHVLANENNAAKGDHIIQRAVFDGGRDPRDQIGTLDTFVRLRTARANFADAALASITPDIGFDPTRLRALVNGKDRTLAGLGPGVIDEGDAVFKVGRTTGPTRGRVTAFALDNVVVNYDIGNVRFDDQIEIEGFGNRPFSDGGDSGSLIVNSGMKAVALLFAGSETGGRNDMGLTYANPIHRVLSDVKATLAF